MLPKSSSRLVVPFLVRLLESDFALSGIQFREKVIVLDVLMASVCIRKPENHPSLWWKITMLSTEWTF